MHILPLLLLCWSNPVDVPTKADWNPGQTHVVIAGVLQWEKNAMRGFSDRNRKDKELSELLLKLGVKKENLTLLLDEQATRKQTLEALAAQAKAAPAESTLIFYYCGHGWHDGHGGGLANYDCRPGNQLLVKDVGEVLARHFQGRRVLFLADCCHSGCLKLAAQMLDKNTKQAVVLTSADSSNVSTGNWTFTQTVIDALRGDRLMDHNADGVISLKEMGEEVTAAMRYREQQRCCYATFNIPGEYRMVMTDLSKPQPPRTQGKFAIGEYVLAQAGPRPRPARIVGRDGEKYVVEFYGYSEKSRATLAETKLQEFPRLKTYPVGTVLAVLWDNKPFKAKVLKVEKDNHLITYPGWSSDWDEWLTAERILGEYKLEAAPRLVQVEWKGKWYPAVPLAQKDGKHYIRYVGFDESWNEWVPPERMREEGKK